MEFESTADAYVAPAITVIGSLHELTLDTLPVGKDFAPHSDGYTFQGKSINVS